MDDFLTLTPAFNYYYVAHNVWGDVISQVKEDENHHLQYVAAGTSVYSTAGKAGSWLGNAKKKITRLMIVAHGSPGTFFLGQDITSENIAPLGGWLYSFFEQNAAGIQILGCNSAADSTQVIGQYEYGQAHPLNEVSLSHRGYELLRALAGAARQKVEGALHGQSKVGLTLRMTCRRVYPNGAQQLFVAGGVKEPGL